jgi:hypothetical protein
VTNTKIFGSQRLSLLLAMEAGGAIAECRSLASPCESPGWCARVTEAVSANTNSHIRSCWPSSVSGGTRTGTFREAEVRLGEHRELRQKLGLMSAPDFTALFGFLEGPDDQTIDLAVGETAPKPMRLGMCYDDCL